MMRGVVTMMLTSMMLMASPARAYEDTTRHFTDPVAQEKAEAQFDTYDPLETMNRGVYKFNALFDKYVFLPLVDGYKFILPEYADVRVTNFFSNIGEFRNVTNSALQGKPDKVFSSIGRFVLNSTVGILGLYDPASAIGLKPHTEDFGQTLAIWGVGAGPYLVLPLLGPTNVRDAFGLAVDTVALTVVTPQRIERNLGYQIAYYGLQPINVRAHNDFRYYASGSPFEYDLVRYITSETRRILIMD